MKCKICKQHITPDCMYMNGECVFCVHDTNEWDSNGEIITKERSIESMRDYYRKIKNIRKKHNKV